jgi:hypothetical protein
VDSSSVTVSASEMMALQTASNHLRASEITLAKITESLSMRTVTLANMAATITASQSFAAVPKGDAKMAVSMAVELLEMVEAHEAKAKALQAALESKRGTGR